MANNLSSLEEYDTLVNSRKNIEHKIAHPEQILSNAAFYVVHTIMPQSVMLEMQKLGIDNLEPEMQDGLYRDLLNFVFFGQMMHYGNTQTQILREKMICIYESYIKEHPADVANIAKMSVVVILQSVSRVADAATCKFHETPKRLGEFADDVKSINKAIDELV